MDLFHYILSHPMDSILAFLEGCLSGLFAALLEWLQLLLPFGILAIFIGIFQAIFGDKETRKEKLIRDIIKNSRK